MRNAKRQGNARVLVVDDDKFMRDMLSALLASDGYSVQTASDGAIAWQLLDSGQPFDVVVSDRTMPNMTGLDLLLKIREDRRFDDVPVIFQTSLSSQREILEGIRAGVYHYLIKPYDQKILLALVDVAIEQAYGKSRANKVGDNRVALDLLYKAEFRCRTLNDVNELSRHLAELSCNPNKVIGGLSELLLNAVEHGNLGISYQEKTDLVINDGWQQEVERRLLLPENLDKFVQVKIVRDTTTTTFTLKDQGNGFEPAKYLNFDPERVMDVHGRGIAMSRLTSFDSLQYVGCGNQVIASVNRA